MGTIYSTSIGGPWKEEVVDDNLRRLKNTTTKKVKGKSSGKSNTKSK